MGLQSAFVVLILLTGHSAVNSGVKVSFEGELKREKSNDQNPKIKCTISTNNVNWRSENTSAAVSVEIQFQGPTELSVMPSLRMIALPKTHGLDQNEYWAPFTIINGVNTKEAQKLSAVKGASTRSVRLVPVQLLWASTKSSVWPSQGFAKTVHPGDYSVEVQLEINGRKTICSNEITIAVLK